jgi:putative Mn2+ efflux pump MntP
MLTLALVYRTIYGVAGGYVTAMTAPKKPLRHAIILGTIGIILSTLGAIVGWDLSAHWYPIALVITALPSTWVGAKLKEQKNSYEKI